ncbi:hypothetical protein L1987_43844 [Smallanthus sonchifolius]|uniref:Uncharacterized protein n=1 Tax=Smallanthus sonchifolius TaxID=185202 RepID=A0ACB9GMM5_9ASTR|nr:hypothetical protein L1987_43844 [Smallanthus sonchifolius]
MVLSLWYVRGPGVDNVDPYQLYDSMVQEVNEVGPSQPRRNSQEITQACRRQLDLDVGVDDDGGVEVDVGVDDDGGVEVDAGFQDDKGVKDDEGVEEFRAFVDNDIQEEPLDQDSEEDEQDVDVDLDDFDSLSDEENDRPPEEIIEEAKEGQKKK